MPCRICLLLCEMKHSDFSNRPEQSLSHSWTTESRDLFVNLGRIRAVFAAVGSDGCSHNWPWWVAYIVSLFVRLIL